MLTGIKNDLMYILNMLESIEKILIYSQNVYNAEDFYELNDQLNFNATLNLFANIGENVGKVSEELKLTFTEINWKQIKGLRNRVVHDYINIDSFMVFDIIKDNLTQLKKSLVKIISVELEKGNFDMEEYCQAEKSFYYRHIDFSSFGL